MAHAISLMRLPQLPCCPNKSAHLAIGSCSMGSIHTRRWYETSMLPQEIQKLNSSAGGAADGKTCSGGPHAEPGSHLALGCGRPFRIAIYLRQTWVQMHSAPVRLEATGACWCRWSRDKQCMLEHAACAGSVEAIDILLAKHVGSEISIAKWCLVIVGSPCTIVSAHTHHRIPAGHARTRDIS